MMMKYKNILLVKIIKPLCYTLSIKRFYPGNPLAKLLMKNYKSMISAHTLNIWYRSSLKYVRDFNLQQYKLPTFYIQPDSIITQSLLIANSPKKDYYLPLPAKNIEVPRISGLATLSEQLRTKLLTDPLYAKEFSQFILMETSKILYYLFNTKLSDKEILHVIPKCFSLIYPSHFFKAGSALKELYDTKYISICQHILNLIFYNKEFDKVLLEAYWNYKIDFSLYPDKIPISVLIESYICAVNIKPFIDSSSCTVNVIAINHENPLLKEPNHIFVKQESMKQIAQQYADFLLSKNNIKQKILDKFYRDVKADYHGPAKGHYTLIPYLTTNLTVVRKYMNSYTSFLTAQIKLKRPISNTLLETFKFLKGLQDGLTKKNIKEQFIYFNATLFDLSIDSEMVDMDINITVASDVEYNTNFETTMLPEIEENIKQHPTIFDAHVFFPKKRLPLLEYDNKMREIINKIMPKELRENLLENYNELTTNN